MRRFALLALALVLAFSPALALDIPARPTNYVNDYAGVLSAADREALNQDLKDFEKATSTQIFVAIFPSLEGEEHADFGVRLASAWKVGTKKDNGVLLDVFMKDRAIGIEVGYGLEGALPDVTCDRIIRDEMAPLFKQGDYAGGIKVGVAKIQAATRGEYTAGDSSASGDSSELSLFEKVLIVGFIVLVIVLQLLFGKRGRSGRWSSGGGFHSSGGGGGFSGGGGGSFGGGGAHGGW